MLHKLLILTIVELLTSSLLTPIFLCPLSHPFVSSATLLLLNPNPPLSLSQHEVQQLLLLEVNVIQ